MLTASALKQPSVSTTERWRSTKCCAVHYSLTAPAAAAAAATVRASLQIPPSSPRLWHDAAADHSVSGILFSVAQIEKNERRKYGTEGEEAWTTSTMYST